MGCDATSLAAASAANNLDALSDKDMLKCLVQLRCQQAFSRTSDQFTRPADGTPYTSQDSVNQAGSPRVLTFAGIVPVNGGAGIIRQARFSIQPNNSNWGGGGATFVLNLYNQPVSATADNAPFVTNTADNAAWIGRITAPATSSFLPTTVAGGSFNAGFTLPNLPFLCLPGDKNLYGLLKVTGTPTPTAGTIIVVELITEML